MRPVRLGAHCVYSTNHFQGCVLCQAWDKTVEDVNPQHEPLFFVITTTYRASPVIGRTFSSLLSQTKNNFVHYIYEDASDDPEFDQIVHEYMSKVSRLPNPYKVIYEKGTVNLGCDKAHEYVFRKVFGTHLIWLDQGDYVAKDFFAKMSSEVRRHPHSQWFHINCIHYDLKTGRTVGKADNRRFERSMLYREDQLVPWTFGQFYYHLFVFSVPAFRDCFNKNVEIIDKKEHGGCFYDAQIVLRAIALQLRMHYVRPLLGFVMIDPSSVSTGYVGDAQMADRCIERILDGDERFARFRSFYIPYKRLVRNAAKTHLLCAEKDGRKRATHNVDELVRFLRNWDCPILRFYPDVWKHRLILFIALVPGFRRLLRLAI